MVKQDVGCIDLELLNQVLEEYLKRPFRVHLGRYSKIDLSQGFEAFDLTLDQLLCPLTLGDVRDYCLSTFIFTILGG